MAEERKTIQEAAAKKAEDSSQLQIAELKKVISDLTKQTVELKRKAEQGSQQLQGEVQELELEKILGEAFVYDEIRPVAKGVSGADCQQMVKNQRGSECGSILWESKRTQNWGSKWIDKLRDDQREAKADVAVLVSEVLPEGVESFELIDGVWVCSWASARVLASVLRQGLIELGNHKQALVGREEKSDLVYNYLTGQEFRNRVDGFIEPMMAMKAQLEKEKRAMNRHWAERDKQLDRAINSAGGMYGDLKGIFGASIQEIEHLSLTAEGDKGEAEIMIERQKMDELPEPNASEKDESAGGS